MVPTNALAQLTQSDGDFRFRSPAYQLTIGSDGNVRSLIVGNTAILGIGPDGKSGAFFLDENEKIAGFSHVEPHGTNELVCTEGDATLRYRFLPDRIEISRNNAGSRYANWAWLPSDHVTRSLDALHDGAIDLINPPFDGYQPHARWLTDSGVVIHMPYVTWMRKEKAMSGRNVAILSHSFGMGDEEPLVIRPVPAPRPEDAIVFHIQCENPDFLVPGGTTEMFSVRAENASSNDIHARARFRVLTFLDRNPIASNETSLRIAGGESQPLALTATLKEPSVYRAELTLLDGKREARKLEWVFAYDWAHWSVPLNRPADFAGFWKKTLQEMRSQALDAVVTPQPDLNGYKLFKVNFRSLGDHRVYGWYYVPPGDGPFPATLFLPGNGVYQMPSTLKTPLGRYAMLIIQVHGYDVDLSNYPKPPPWEAGNYWREWNSREDAFARVIYANCSRAVDFLTSRPEVNKDEVYVDGGSQGGGLSIITAALNPNLKGACVQYPGLCHLDWLYRHFLDSPFPWNGKSPKPAGMSDKEFLRVLSYFDAANFVPDIRCPVNALIALQDQVTIGGTSLAAMRNLNAPLTLVNGVWCNHRSDERTNEANKRWLQQTLLK